MHSPPAAARSIRVRGEVGTSAKGRTLSDSPATQMSVAACAGSAQQSRAASKRGISGQLASLRAAGQGAAKEACQAAVIATRRSFAGAEHQHVRNLAAD